MCRLLEQRFSHLRPPRLFAGQPLRHNARRQTTHIGRTSVVVRVTVSADRFGQLGQSITVTQAEVVFVAVDDSGNPMPVLDD